MPVHPNPTHARHAPADRLIRARHTLVVSVTGGHGRIHTPGNEPSCPECSASARRSFTLFRDLREDQR